jgi:hypothetical protein
MLCGCGVLCYYTKLYHNITEHIITVVISSFSSSSAAVPNAGIKFSGTAIEGHTLASLVGEQGRGE